MICGVLEVESIVQVNDKTRLDATKSFVTKGNDDIQKVEICPEYIDVSSEFIDITSPRASDWFLDWLYTGVSRSVTAKLRVTTTEAVLLVDSVYSEFSKTIAVKVAADDMLFSGDDDIKALEPDILKWVPDGRASWLNVHRAAQEKIMDALNKMGIEDSDGLALTAADVVDLDEVKFWSRDLTLALIFKGVQNIKDDVFAEKAKFYFGEASKATSRAKLRLDLDHDGEIEKSESIGFRSAPMVRT